MSIRRRCRADSATGRRGRRGHGLSAAVGVIVLAAILGTAGSAAARPRPTPPSELPRALPATFLQFSAGNSNDPVRFDGTADACESLWRKTARRLDTKPVVGLWVALRQGKTGCVVSAGKANFAQAEFQVDALEQALVMVVVPKKSCTVNISKRNAEDDWTKPFRYADLKSGLYRLHRMDQPSEVRKVSALTLWC